MIRIILIYLSLLPLSINANAMQNTFSYEEVNVEERNILIKGKTFIANVKEEWRKLDIPKKASYWSKIVSETKFIGLLNLNISTEGINCVTFIDSGYKELWDQNNSFCIYNLAMQHIKNFK